MKPWKITSNVCGVFHGRRSLSWQYRPPYEALPIPECQVGIPQQPLGLRNNCLHDEYVYIYIINLILGFVHASRSLLWSILMFSCSQRPRHVSFNFAFCHLLPPSKLRYPVELALNQVDQMLFCCLATKTGWLHRSRSTNTRLSPQLFLLLSSFFLFTGHFGLMTTLYSESYKMSKLQGKMRPVGLSSRAPMLEESMVV